MRSKIAFAVLVASALATFGLAPAALAASHHRTTATHHHTISPKVRAQAIDPMPLYRPMAPVFYILLLVVEPSLGAG